VDNDAAANGREAGKAAREYAPRSSHAEWEPQADRRDPVEVLVDQATSRVPDLVPIRYGRMLASPFAFFRGAAAVMAMDLAKTPQSGLRAQLCGDAHLSNFGIFSHHRVFRALCGPEPARLQRARRRSQIGPHRSRDGPHLTGARIIAAGDRAKSRDQTAKG
jgi:Uncharacterized protein conserved in bacteria (DUF2252)